MADPEHAQLRRVVSFRWLVLYGLGTTIGAGIYALTGVVAGRAGMHAPVAFLVAALLALFTALSFAELSSRFPRAGGEAVYVLEGFRSQALTRAVGLSVVLAGLVSAATVSVGMVGYLAELVALPRAPAIVALLLLVGGIAAYGVRESVLAAGLVTLVEIGGLIAVIVVGGGQTGDVAARLGEILPRDSGGFGAVGAAAILCFYAFLGFEDMVNVAEEVRDVRRVLPRAILTTLVITTLLYAMVTTVAVSAVPTAELAASSAPLSLVFERGGGSAGALAIVAILALANGALIQLVKGSRVLYGLAREGSLPAFFARVHPRTGTPLVSTALATLVAGVFALSLPLEALAGLTSLVTLGTFTLTNLALVRVKRRETLPPPDATVFPIWVPWLGAVASFGFIVFELTRAL